MIDHDNAIVKKLKGQPRNAKEYLMSYKRASILCMVKKQMYDDMIRQAKEKGAVFGKVTDPVPEDSAEVKQLLSDMASE